MKFLVLAWALAALLLFHDARAVRDYLSVAGAFGLRGAAESPTPLTQVYPAFASDAQTWVRHALSLHEGRSLRLRHTTIDNAPEGREVHWNSAWAWTIVAAGRLHEAITGALFPRAVEKATLWLPPAALFAIIVVFSTWAFRHLGLRAAIFLVAAMALHERVLEGFFPAYVDHHGLLTACVLGLVLGAVTMVRGMRAGAVFSAVCGALGLWVSAASVVPAIAVTAVAGAVAVRWRPGDARTWRTWGLVGAGASLAFYLFEYFPRHLALRLEVNHPLYAMAWLGGAELVSRLCEPARARTLAEKAWPWLALLALPATAIVGGARVISFTDPFMARVHADIREFLPLWTTTGIADPGLVFRLLLIEPLPVLAAAVTIARMGRESPPELVFATLVAGALLAMACWQVRWQLNASAAGICLALVLIETWTARRAPAARWIAASLVVALLFLPGGFVRYNGTRHALATRTVSTGEAGLALDRDIAAALRASQPQGELVLLASPNASTSIGYYGRFKTLGTLYWENGAGLKAAAAILSAKDDAEGERLLRARGVTHIALLSDDNFVAGYHRALHPDARREDIEASLGWRLLSNAPPPYLQRIPYEVPPELRVLNTVVLLYKTGDAASPRVTR